MLCSFLQGVFEMLAADPFKTAELIIDILALVGLLSVVAALVSMRSTACNQLYSRWQTLLFEYKNTDQAHETLTETAYEQNGSTRPAAHYIAVAYLNLFEEAYLYHQSRVLGFWRVLPDPFWKSIKKSMRKQFRQYRYIRTLWKEESDSWSDDFNSFVRKEIIDKPEEPWRKP